MKLKIQQRGQDDNQFVRIHPQTILRLVSEASSDSSPLRDNGDLDVDSNSGWTLNWDQRDDIQFLPIRIDFNSETDAGTNSETLYCSYNGGLCENENFIDLPKSFSQSGEYQGTFVSVTVLTSVFNAASIQIEPLSISDWELLEIFAQELEEGLLLGQISIVFPGQCFNLVLGSDIVNVRVLEDGFRPVLEDLGPSISNSNSSLIPLRLVSDTEVIVSPKSRSKASEIKDTSFPLSEPMKIIPCEMDFSADMTKMQNLFNESLTVDNLICAPPPLTALVHPDSIMNIPGWDVASFPNHNASFPTSRAHAWLRKPHESREMAVAQLVASEAVPENCVVLHPTLRLQLGVSPLFDSVTVQVLSRRSVECMTSSFSDALDTGSLSLAISPISFIFKHDSSKDCLPDDSESATGKFCDFSHASVRARHHLHAWRQQAVAGGYFDSDFLLCQGSILSIPLNDDSTLHFQVRIKDHKEEAKKTLPMIQNDQKERPEYLHHAFDLSRAVIDQNDTVISLPVNERLLNLLPASNLPTKEYLSFVSGVEQDLVWNFEEHGNFLLEDSGVRNVMICGDEGCGKTYCSIILAARLRLSTFCNTVYLDCRQLQATQTRMDHVLDELTRAFMKASLQEPSLLLLDNLDDLIPNANNSSGLTDDSAQQQQQNPLLISQSKLLADHTKFLMAGLGGRKVAVVCTTVNENRLNKSLRSIRTFASKRKVPSLSETDKFELFFNCARKLGYCPQSEEFSAKNFAKMTESFSPKDLKVVATKVALKHKMQSLRSSSNGLSVPSAESIIAKHTPLAEQTLQLEQVPTKFKWSDIGGLFEPKISLSSILLKPIKYRMVYKHAPISLPRGVLLYGFPGCGKSCIVPALAQECGFNLVTCRGPELLDKYIGASEAKVRMIFEKAYAAAPSILFLDEFEALAPRRGSDNTGVTDRVVNQLLTFLDGVEVQGTSDDKIVYIIAASSRPDKIDPALLRPGRLEKHVFVGYPRSDEEWDDLLFKVSETKNVDEETGLMIENGSFRSLLSERKFEYRKMSAADMKGVFNTAHLSAVHDFLRNRESLSDKEVTVTIKKDHLLDGFLSTRPSISDVDYDMFSRAFIPFLGADRDTLIRDFGLDPEALNSPTLSKLKTALK